MTRRWNPQDDVKLNHLVRQQKDWKDIVKYFPGRNEREVRARYVHRFTNRLQKMWTPDEDQKLVNHYYNFGFSKWLSVARQLSRSVRECKDRWVRHIGPQLENNGVQSQIWTETEDCEILRMFQAYGPKWGLMSNQLRGRTANEIRCRWETKLRRRQKYNQSIRKANFGIQVTVIRKGKDEWGQKGEAEPSYLLPKKEAEDLGYFKRRNRSPLKAIQSSVATTSRRHSQPPPAQPSDMIDVSLQDLESEFPNISKMLPDGDLDDLSRLDMDFVDFLGISAEDGDEVFDNGSTNMQETENIPLTTDMKENVEVQRPYSLDIPLELDPPDHSDAHRNGMRKQDTSSVRSACSSSPSPTTPEYLSELVKSSSGSQPQTNQDPDVDDREAFIKKFKQEIERDLTELQMKNSPHPSEVLIDNSVFMGCKDGDSPPTLKSYVKKKELYEVSQLVSPMKSSSSYDLSANSVLNLATEVEAEDLTPPPKRRIVTSRIVRRIDQPSQRIIPRSNRFSTSTRIQPREGRSFIRGVRVMKDSTYRSLREKYDPVRFSFRRVLQIGNDRRWRHVALGSSRTQIIMTSQANAFLRRHSS